MFEKTSSTLDKSIIKNFDDSWLGELKQNIKGSVRWDTVTLQLYSTAACFYEITPLAVVIPEDLDDIITTVNLCAKYKIPILPRGAGSSLSGNAVGKAVILDLTHNFKEIKHVNDNKVKCDVGVVLNSLQDELKKKNKKFGPDPSSGNVCVIGGMLGNNSGGPHTIKHGSMFNHVEEVNVILSNGKIINARNIPINEIQNLDSFHKHYYENVKLLLEKYKTIISSSKPRATKNASGYQVWDVLTETNLNMASLMVGSEGTLGVFTDAVLRIIPIVKYRGIISLYFDDIEKMGTAVKYLRELGASAIEFVDQSFIELAVSYRPELKKFLPENVKYLLYVEYEDNDINKVEELLIETKKVISEEKKLAEVGLYSTDEEEIANIFKVRKAATVILNKIQGKEKPVPFVEDAAIHPDVFSEFLVDLSSLLKNYSFKYAVFGHAGDGNLHLRPILNFKNEKSFREAQDLMQKFVDLVIKYKGTLSGEHGDGRLRTPLIEKSFKALMPLFKEIKNLFDPIDIMNPEIKVTNKKYGWNENLRYTPDYCFIPTNSKLDTESWRIEIEKCHGCGTCREYCPVFVATGKEEATARAKANILRGIISGKISQSEIDSNQFYQIMDYCLNCGQCLTDCPTNVNIPGMAVLAKEKLHEKRPFKINEIILQRGKLVSSLASLFSFISNKFLSISMVRKMMHLSVGIHYNRKFPKFSRLTKPKQQDEYKKKIVLWTGCAAQFNDPEGELQSSLELFNKLGYEIILPKWKCCNVAKLSYGNIEDSIKDIEFNIKTLLPYVDQNIPIVFTAASCGYAFMHEYPTFFGNKIGVKKIADASYDIHDFLGNTFLNGNYSGFFEPIEKKVVYHAPCHLKTQNNKFGPNDLMKLIPGLQLLKINDSCCGIAGTFGMKKENFDLSMEIGSKLFEEINNAEADLVLSGCGMCQIQINQGTGLEVIHPISLLNQAYQPK
ncbi:MAG: anaerobic glycerol-3-phosphate dehydrogenase subunit C [Melioribacteraceae bacterium]|nr:anaerobic glycerol-3-phosphate dehydrogenase subunit C [Melioribacteraceae bacterium]